jgi:hypothetical protein
MPLPRLRRRASCNRFVHEGIWPYRPQANEKTKRFRRVRAIKLPDARPYLCGEARRRALATWLHIYNRCQYRTTLGGSPPT